MLILNDIKILNIYKYLGFQPHGCIFLWFCFPCFSEKLKGFLLSLLFLDRDATRYLYISKANTKSICVIMQFSCICCVNLSTSICKLLNYKKFKGLAESQIRPSSNTKTSSTREISKSTSRQQNIKWCIERHKMWYKFIKWLLLFYLISE